MMKYILFGWALCLVGSCTPAEHSGQESSQKKIDSLQAALKGAEARVDSLLMNGRSEPAENRWYTKSIEGRILQRQGIEDPESFIEQSLMQRPELIPMEPVMGGTMRFVRAQVLGREWIVAEFEDGHVMGRAIYSYQITADGSIEFTALASTNSI